MTTTLISGYSIPMRHAILTRWPGLEAVASSTPTTMSSREIAELTGKQHAHVLRDFRDVCDALEIAASNFGSGYLDANGQERTQYLLPKDLTTTLISGYSIPMRHAIVTRWLELEAAAAPALPASYREAF